MDVFFSLIIFFLLPQHFIATLHNSIFQRHFMKSMKLKVGITLVQVIEHSESGIGVEDISPHAEIDSDIKKATRSNLGLEDKGNHQTSDQDNDGLEDVYGADGRTSVEDVSLQGKIDSDSEDKGDQRPSSPFENVVLNHPSRETFVKETVVILHFQANNFLYTYFITMFCSYKYDIKPYTSCSKL